MRFGCLERPRPGCSSIFIDFHGFGRHPKPESLIPCGSLWRPVAACGSLWRPVAAIWTPLYIDFLDFGGILSCWMMNARLMEAEQRLGGCRMMNGRHIGRRSHTLELEELGGYFNQRNALNQPSYWIQSWIV